MKIIKKIAAIITAVAVTAAASVSAGALTVYDWWKEADLQVVDGYAQYLEDGDECSEEFEYMYHGLHWKFEAPYNGVLELDIECGSRKWSLSVCDEDGNTIKACDLDTSLGASNFDIYDNIKFFRNSTKKKTVTTVSYELKKGVEYYLLFTNENDDEGYLDFSVDYSKASLDSCFTVNMKKGDKIQLNAGSGTKWSSSKKNIAAVSSDGKITAKKSGTAIITAKTGNKKLTIKVKVA